MSAISLQGSASGTGTLTVAAPSTNTNRTLTLPDGTGTFSVAGVNSNIVAGTLVASTSGTSIDFTSIPSYVKRITVMFNGVSTTSTSNLIAQIGSGSVTATGYLGAGATVQNAGTTTAANFTTGFCVSNSVAATTVLNGMAILSLVNGATNTWSFSCTLGRSDGASVQLGSGVVPLSGALDRVRITTVNGTDTFDAGSINILYE